MGRKYKSYTHEEYERAMELLKKGYTQTETCRILGWPKTKTSILYYWRRGRIPPLARWKPKPCVELAYIKGTVDGDASITKNKSEYQYKIKLATIDPEFAETFSKASALLLNKKYCKPWWNKKEKMWQVEYNSKAFYEWYKRTEKQSLEGFKPFIEHSKETVKYYLRGLYDSEGNNDGNKQIYLCNSNEELLEYVQYLLEEYFDIVATGPYLQKEAGTKTVIKGIEYHYNNDYYVISISRKEHVRRFLEEIGFSIVRKQLGLKKDEKVFVEGRYVEPYELIKNNLYGWYWLKV